MKYCKRSNWYFRRQVAETTSLGGSGGGGGSGRGGQEQRLDDLDQANQEIDRLRKTVEKLQGELQGNFITYNNIQLKHLGDLLFYFLSKVKMPEIIWQIIALIADFNVDMFVTN